MCSRSLNKLAQPLPMAHCANSRLVCKISGDVMNENNPPMMLPNGYVYGYNVRDLRGRAWRGGGEGWAGPRRGRRGGAWKGLVATLRVALRQVSCTRCGHVGPTLSPVKPQGQGSRAGLQGSRALPQQAAVCASHAAPVFQSLLSIRQDDKVVCPRTKEVFHFSQAEKVYIM